MEIDSNGEEENLAFVIRATNIVETKMKRVISRYIKPGEDKFDFVSSHLLNNATVPFGAKIKIILAIAKRLSVKVDRNAFHTLLSRRNAFAHQDHLGSIRIVNDKDGRPDVSFILESIKSSGELEAVTQSKAFSEFFEAYARVEGDLENLLSALDSEQ